MRNRSAGASRGAARSSARPAAFVDDLGGGLPPRPQVARRLVRMADRDRTDRVEFPRDPERLAHGVEPCDGDAEEARTETVVDGGQKGQ